MLILANWTAVFVARDDDTVNVAFAVAVLHRAAWLSLTAARLRTDLVDAR